METIVTIMFMLAFALLWLALTMFIMGLKQERKRYTAQTFLFRSDQRLIRVPVRSFKI